MTDQELKTMIRESVARHLGAGVRAGATAISDDRSSVPLGLHASHLRLALLSGGDGDGACLIEPAVRCNHCGYCLSYGH